MNALLANSAPLITDPTWIFFLVLVIILFAPLLLRRLHIPHVIGLILAGIIIGQYGFNLLARDSSFELFGQVGIYYIMFVAGLELDMGSVARYGRRGVQFGLLTFLIPFVLGFASAYYILHYSIPTSLLLACIFSSHTLVSYPIVGRYGLGRHRSVVISVIATAIATLAALLVLAIVVGSLDSKTGTWHWVFFTFKCIAYMAIVIGVFPKLGRWFLRRYDDSVMQYIFLLAMVFLSAALAELAGLEGLLGAFLAGLVASRLVPQTSPLMTRIEFVGNALFIPYFLIGVGMLIDIRVLLSDRYTLWVVAVMVLTATLTKWIASLVMRYTSRGNNTSMTLMFGLTNAHAAGALAIVMIGTDPQVHLMDTSILNGTVMLILFSCIISSLATSHAARKTALSDTTLEQNRGSYHGKCLVTYAYPHMVDIMTQLAILIRNPYIPDSLMGLNVAYDDDRGVDYHQQGKAFLEKAKSIAASADVNMSTMSRVSPNIAAGIIHTMKEYDVGEVLMGWHQEHVGEMSTGLGNVASNVVMGTHRELMLVHAIVPPGTMRRIIVMVPQKAEYEVGFYKWLEHICRIGEQLDCRLIFRAHSDTMPYIIGYMREKHGSLRALYQEENETPHLYIQPDLVGQDDMCIFVTARHGFISHTNRMHQLPRYVAQHYAHTSVMLLYPDQWGDPVDTLSIFAPNGQVVTRQPHTVLDWAQSKLLKS